MALTGAGDGRPSVLVLRALGLGDLLSGVPALRAVRRAHPGHEVVLAAPRALEPLVRLAEVVDRVVDARELAPVPWAGPAPELAVNLHGKGPQSHRLLQDLRPGRLVAFGCAEAGHDGPVWRPDEHERRRWCRLVAESLAVPADPDDLLLSVPSTAPPVEAAVVVHPGAAFGSRRWPAERYAAVARWASDAGHRVVVTGGPDETGLAQAVCEAAGLPTAASLAGTTDLESLAALVASARLVVCGDTGVAHLASAYATPSVLLFGPTAPATWGPPAGGPHRVLWHGDGTGDPRGREVDPALDRVSVEEVLAAAAATLRRVPSSAGACAPPGGAG